MDSRSDTSTDLVWQTLRCFMEMSDGVARASCWGFWKFSWPLEENLKKSRRRGSAMESKDHQ